MHGHDPPFLCANFHSKVQSSETGQNGGFLAVYNALKFDRLKRNVGDMVSEIICRVKQLCRQSPKIRLISSELR